VLLRLFGGDIAREAALPAGNDAENGGLERF